MSEEPKGQEQPANPITERMLPGGSEEEEDWKAVAAWLGDRGWQPIGSRGRRSFWASPKPEDTTVYTRLAAVRAARESEAWR